MYTSSPIAPVTAGALAFTGTAAYFTLGLAVALFVLGGMILAVLNLLPRLAWEPIDEANGPKMRFTFNGHPLRRRH